jgi:hypothetical protein
MANRVGNVIYNNFDQYTGVPFNATVVTTWYDGSSMSDSKVDNAIYFKLPPELGGGWAKRDYEGAVRPQWWGAKGDWNVFTQTGTNNTISLQKMINSVPNGTVVDWGERKFNYGFYQLNIVGKSNLVFKGEASLSGQLYIGDPNASTPFVYQMVIDGLTFDLSKYASQIAALLDPLRTPLPEDRESYHAINLANAFEIDITNCYQKSGNAFCYINKLNVTQHVARLRLNNIKRGRALNLPDFNQSSPNYLLYVDNTAKGDTDYATVNTGLGDALVSDCGSSFARIANIEGYGIDGIVISNCIFFMLPSSDKDQFKGNNIKIAKCNWLNLTSCQMFEAGLEGILLERVARFSMSNLNIAWAGERDCNFGYGFRIENKNAGLMSGTISNIIIDEPTRQGFLIGPGMHDINISNVNVRNVGSPNQYYGNGALPVGDPGTIPALSSVVKKGGSYDVTAYSINITNCSSSNADFDFPYQFGSSIPLNQRTYCLNNTDTRGMIEKNTTFITSLTTASQILDSNYAQTVELAMGTPTGTVGGISNVRPQCFVFLANQSSANANVTVINSASFKLKGGVNAVIPFGEGIMFYSKGGIVREVSRTFNIDGTVTNVSSANTDIDVANGSTTPVLTFNRNGAYVWGGTFNAFTNGVSIGKTVAPTSFLLEVEGATAIAQLKRNSAITTNAPKILLVRTGSTLTNDILANYILGGLQFRGRIGGVDTDWGQLGYITNSVTPGDGKFVFYKNDLVTSVFDINNNTGDVTVTGIMVVPTPGTNIATTRAANTAWVNTYFAPLVSPALSGVPTAPTATAGTNSTQLATTAYVDKNAITLATISGINAKTVGSTALYTVPAGRTAIITGVYVHCTAATGITVGASADVGVIPGDIYSAMTINAITLNKVFQYPTGGTSTAATAGQVINFNLNTAATGTSQTLAVTIIGFLK